LRVLAGMTAGGVFPNRARSRWRPGSGRRAPGGIGKLLFAAMSGNLLGASGAVLSVILSVWRGVSSPTGAMDLIALAVALPGFGA